MRSTGSMADPQRRASTSNTRRSPALPGNAVDIALRTAQGSVDDYRRGAHRLRRLDGVVAIRRRIGLRFFLSDFGESAQREEQNVGDSRRRFDANGVHARSGIGAGFHQEGERAARREHRTGGVRGRDQCEGGRQRGGHSRALGEIPSDRG